MDQKLKGPEAIGRMQSIYDQLDNLLKNDTFENIIQQRKVVQLLCTLGEYMTYFRDGKGQELVKNFADKVQKNHNFVNTMTGLRNYFYHKYPYEQASEKKAIYQDKITKFKSISKDIASFLNFAKKNNTESNSESNTQDNSRNFLLTQTYQSPHTDEKESHKEELEGMYNVLMAIEEIASLKDANIALDADNMLAIRNFIINIGSGLTKANHWINDVAIFSFDGKAFEAETYDNIIDQRKAFAHLLIETDGGETSKVILKILCLLFQH